MARSASRHAGLSSGIEIEVRDNGQGMSAAFMPRVFGFFQQEETATTRRAGGLGLGLAIVKQLVDLHKGTVRAESDGAGKGATFTVWLPLGLVEKEGEPIERPDSGRAGRGADLRGSPEF